MKQWYGLYILLCSNALASPTHICYKPWLAEYCFEMYSIHSVVRMLEKSTHPFFIWGNYCGISVCSALEIESSCCQFIDFLYFTARWSMRRTGGDNSGLAFLFPVWQVAAVAMKQRQYIGNMLLLYFSILLMHLLWAYYGRRNKSKSTLSNLPCWLYFDESNYTYSLYVPFGASLPKASFGCLLKWFDF